MQISEYLCDVKICASPFTIIGLNLTKTSSQKMSRIIRYLFMKLEIWKHDISSNYQFVLVK